MGKEETKKHLMPFTRTLQPILKVMGINLNDQKEVSISDQLLGGGILTPSFDQSQDKFATIDQQVVYKKG
jgi:hypothetical protein